MKTGVLARAAACVLLAGTMSVATAGTSSAATAELNITYSCTFTLIGAQDQPSKVTSPNLPDSATVGVPTAVADTTVTTTVSETAANVLNWLGATTVEGTMTTKVPVDNAGTVQQLTSNLTIPVTPVAPSGTFDVTAAGTLPSMTLANAGTTSISLGAAELTLTPRRSDGTETFLGTFKVPCSVKPGQNTKLYEFQVLGA
ncbi:DUF6801 domain-containing protein [Lentzea sp. NPDC051213]|uniref:DUF6801 domain-containing protein n=1 Tax=Lentzea sp. NPDC051213 TaxID=3364126 RepID=UPI00378D4F3D